MRIPVHRHLTDLAGSGLVLIGFLLAALALSAVPVVIQGLIHRGPPPAHAAEPVSLSEAGSALS